MIDVHCHLLPGVDDGCRDVAESVATARLLAEAGVTDAICTPHVQPAMPHNTARGIAANVARLSAALRKAGVPLRVWPGGENRVGPENLDGPEEDLVLACGGASRGGRFFLFDDWSVTRPELLAPMCRRLTGLGITPILAHPERTPWFWPDPLSTAAELADLGVRLQFNAYVLAGRRDGPPVHVAREMVTTADRLLDAGRYDYLATDTHRPDGWPPRRAGLREARRRLGSDFARLAVGNPRQLLPASDDRAG